VSVSSSEEAPSAEQLLAELQRTRVDDLLVQTVSLLASLGYGKLTPEARDLDQARLAIDAIGALQPLLPAGAATQVRDLVANLQLAYVEATRAQSSPAREPGLDDGPT
jgi:hypothetical protein